METETSNVIAASVLETEVVYEIGSEQQAEIFLEPTLSVVWNIHQGHFDQFEVITLYKCGDGQFTEAYTETFPLEDDRHKRDLILPEFQLDMTGGRDPLSRIHYPLEDVAIKCIVQAVNPKCTGCSVDSGSKIMMSTSAELVTEL